MTRFPSRLSSRIVASRFTHLQGKAIMFESIFKAVIVAVVTTAAEKIIEAINE
jgi:hypothetical protein